jgi:uncharacterized protein (DUF433 family)
MIELDPASQTPLTRGTDGTIRITGSRVTLDSIIDEFTQGATAEQIQEDFPSLTLREIYGAIFYYLEHTSMIEEYLRQQEQDAQEMHRLIERQPGIVQLRERIRARRNQLIRSR